MSRKSNPSLPFKLETAAFLEASTLITVFGKDGKVPIEYLRTWLGKEQLPEGFVSRDGEHLVGIGETATVAAKMKWYAGIF